MRYEVDAAALSNTVNPHEILTEIYAAITQRGFSLETQCQPCHDWDSGRRQVRPNPPFAHDPAESCSGCAFSFLIRQYPLPMEERLNRLKVLAMTIKKSLAWIASTGNERRLRARKSELANVNAQIRLVEANLVAIRGEKRKKRLIAQAFVANRPAEIMA